MYIMKKRLTIFLALLCMSVMGWATQYCHEAMTLSGGATIYLSCTSPSAGNYQIVIEGTNLAGLGGSFFNPGTVDLRNTITTSTSTRIVCDIEAASAPSLYTPLYVLCPGEQNIGWPNDVEWGECAGGDPDPDPDPEPAENPYCNLEIGHQANPSADVNSFILLSVGSDGQGHTIVNIKQDAAKNTSMFDYINIVGKKETGSDVTTGGSSEMAIVFPTPTPDGDGNITFTMQWSTINWGGRWECNVTAPADAVCASANPFPGDNHYCSYTDNQLRANNANVSLTWGTDASGNVVIDIADGDGATNSAFRNGGFENNGSFANSWFVYSGTNFATCEAATTYFNNGGTLSDNNTRFTLTKKADLPANAVIAFCGHAFSWRTDQATGAYTEKKYFAYEYGYNCPSLNAPTNVAVNASKVITFDAITNAETYTAKVYFQGILKYSQVVASGDILNFTPYTTGTYQVQVVASAEGYPNSDPSNAYDWVLTAPAIEVGNSEYCEYAIGNGTSAANITWETTNDGAIVISLDETLGGSEDATHFRGTGMNISNFQVGESPASAYFNHSCGGTNQVTLSLKDADIKPGLGEKIYYTNKVVEWATSGNNNAYSNLTFEYTYGAQCSGQKHVIASVNDGDRGSATVNGAAAADVDAGTQVTCVATPAEGYVFVNWTINGVEVSTNATYTPTITEATTIVANFDYVRNAYCQYIVLSNESAVKGKKLYMTVGSVGGGRYQIKFEGSTEAPLTGLSNANYVGNKISALTDVEDQPKTGNDVPFTKANGRWVFSAEGNGSASMQFELAEGRTIDDIYFWANAIYFNTSAGELGYVDNNDRLGLFGMNATHRHNIAWNETCSDAENPVMTSATLASTTVNSAVINVAATDDHVVDAFRVVETTHGIDVVYPVAAQITITGLTAGNTYNFTITAIDASGKVSANSKAVVVELAAAVTAPTTAAPTPPARDDRWVRPIYSDAYTSILEHDFALSNWGSKAGTREVVAGDNYLLYDFSEGGNTVVWGENNASNNAIVAVSGKNAGGTGDNTGIDASSMEYLHLDIWSNAASNNVEVRINDQMLARVNLSDAGWQQFNLPLSEHIENINTTSVRWMKFTNISGADHIAFDNAYFWREPVAGDEVAPTNVVARAIYADLYSVQIEVSATENNDDVSYSIKLGDEVKAAGSGKSGVVTTIRVADLTPNTDYTFSVIATDLFDNSAAPVNVPVRTKSLPEPAPAPVIRSASVKSLYSNVYDPVCTITNYCENWWQAPALHSGITLAEGDNVLYYDNIPSSSAFGWGFATPKVDAAGFQKLHFDIYPMQSGTIELYPVKEEGGELYRTSQTLVAETWNEVVLDYTNETLEDVFKQLGFRNYSNLGAFFIDNVYFFKTEEATLDQDATTPDALNALNGAIANVEISRTLLANGNFKTLCLPFSMNAEQIEATFGDCEILMLTGGRMKTETDIYVQYSPVNEIVAGKPYLMTVQSDVTGLNFDAVVINSSTDNNEVEVDLGDGKSISMLGTFVKKSLTDDGLYYLDTDGYLHSVSVYGEENGGAAVTIPAFRCYYQFNGFAGNNAPIRARVVRTTDVVTDCEDIVNAPVAIKQLRDGQLFILRDGNRYTVTGLRVE